MRLKPVPAWLLKTCLVLNLIAAAGQAGLGNYPKAGINGVLCLFFLWAIYDSKQED
jgi:hypothetical protein